VIDPVVVLKKAKDLREPHAFSRCLEFGLEASKKPKELREPHAFSRCLEFGLEASKKPKELREPYSTCPDILLFA
jgi:hypothetical protein